MRESIKNYSTCLENIPHGPIKIDNYKIQTTPTCYNENSNGRLNSIILNIYTEGFHIPNSLVLYRL